VSLLVTLELKKGIIALIQCNTNILLTLLFLRLFRSLLLTVRKLHYWVFLFLKLYFVLELERDPQFLNHCRYIPENKRYRRLFRLEPITSPQLRFLHIIHNLLWLRFLSISNSLWCLIILLLLTWIFLLHFVRVNDQEYILLLILFHMIVLSSLFVNLPSVYLLCLYQELMRKLLWSFLGSKLWMLFFWGELGLGYYFSMVWCCRVYTGIHSEGQPYSTVDKYKA